MIIAIISPIRFKKEMMDEYVRLSLEGHIVLLPVDESDLLPENNSLLPLTNEELADVLMPLHKQKIDMAEKVRVLNVGGYMGRGTYEEIGYSIVKGKPIEYLVPVGQLTKVKQRMCTADGCNFNQDGFCYEEGCPARGIR